MFRDLIIAACTFTIAIYNGIVWVNSGNDHVGNLLAVTLGTIGCILSLNAFAKNYHANQASGPQAQPQA